MIRQGKIWLAAGMLALVAAACFDDPTSSLRNGPARLLLDRSTAFITAGSASPLIATVIDEQGNTLALSGTTWESANPAVATVAVDTSEVPGGTFSRAFVTGVAGGVTYVRATANGKTDSVYVAVLPTAFPGTISSTSGDVATDFTLTVGAPFSFDVAEAVVSVNGYPVYITNATASSVSFRSQVAAAGVVTVEGLLLAGVAPVPAVPLSGTIAVADASEPANDTEGGLVVTGVDGSTEAAPVEVYGSIDDGADALDYVTFTTTATSNVRMRLFMGPGNGDGGALNPDVDMWLENAAFTEIGSAYTANNPEIISMAALAAGTYHIAINGWDTGGNAVPYKLVIFQY